MKDEDVIVQLEVAFAHDGQSSSGETATSSWAVRWRAEGSIATYKLHDYFDVFLGRKGWACLHSGYHKDYGITVRDSNNNSTALQIRATLA